MDEFRSLELFGLHDRHPGLTRALGQCFAEAACVCLSRHHQPPVSLLLDYKGGGQSLVLDFAIPDDRVRRAHANEIDATEAGAYGVSLTVLESVAGLVAVQRAETLTGADWYVARKGADLEDFEECLRLEVSGIGSGTSADVRRRLSEKLDQAARGRSDLPAMAAVVGFRVLEVAISSVGGAE